ncbi:MAG: hypothetical protein Q7T56_16090 [Nocardioidaceae bacterium]|nr:hypothetical protein [Nocardioidaceae bacterium]
MSDQALPPLPHHAAQLEWAIHYDAYTRLAKGPAELAEVLRPAREQYAELGWVPDWCGLDLLRGWAFFLQRTDHHNDALTFDPETRREWVHVLQAVAEHPAARWRDRPPGVERRAPEPEGD